MSKRLSAEDCHAVDLLLERSDKPMVEMVFARPIRGKFEERLDSVEKILSVLENMPVPEPAEDLVQRTMAKIEASQGRVTASQPPVEKSLDDRTHA